jgi:hypothetical protein
MALGFWCSAEAKDSRLCVPGNDSQIAEENNDYSKRCIHAGLTLSAGLPMMKNSSQWPAAGCQQAANLEGPWALAVTRLDHSTKQRP